MNRYKPNRQKQKKAMKERKILEEASRKFKKALKHANTIQEIPEYILETSNLWTLTQEEREQLYHYWVQRMIEVYGLVVKRYSDKYANKIKQLEVITTAIDLYILKQATIVGMTTTGAARNAKLIRKLKPRIVIVDEAGEVLEAHIITSLTQSVEHLIMIGDPQMLKPSTAVSRLSDQYNLNLSLFERLILNDFRHATLSLQHRMRPEISSVMRLIYPMLVDNYIVAEYEHMRGVSVNMFFLTHEFYEDPLAEDSTSRSNTHEAYFVIELALYLIKQGYRQDEITILTFYNGQKYLIEDNLSKRLSENGVKVSTVDKFQGEENEIIILSIVRGNKENYIGHCCVDNRTCVAFSRIFRSFIAFFVSGGLVCICSFPELISSSFVSSHKPKYSILRSRIKYLSIIFPSGIVKSFAAIIANGFVSKGICFVRRISLSLACSPNSLSQMSHILCLLFITTLNPA